MTDDRHGTDDGVQADGQLRLTDAGLELPAFLQGYVGEFTLRTADVTGTFETTDHGLPESEFYDGALAVYPADDGDYNPDLAAGYMALATPGHGEETFEVVDERSESVGGDDGS